MSQLARKRERSMLDRERGASALPVAGDGNAMNVIASDSKRSGESACTALPFFMLENHRLLGGFCIIG